VLAPYNSSNYANESTSLVKDDPRSSHASVWMYLERVPLFVYAPGIVEPSDNTDRVTLADLAPTAAHLMGFDGFRAEGACSRGRTPATPPKVVDRVCGAGTCSSTGTIPTTPRPRGPR
jgi:hypothetical protein